MVSGVKLIEPRHSSNQADQISVNECVSLAEILSLGSLFVLTFVCVCAFVAYYDNVVFPSSVVKRRSISLSLSHS